MELCRRPLAINTMLLLYSLVAYSLQASENFKQCTMPLLIGSCVHVVFVCLGTDLCNMRHVPVHVFCLSLFSCCWQIG